MIFRKRGLTNNFLGIIIAIIGIVGLVFLGVKIYNSFEGLEDKNAQEVIGDLKGKMDNLGDGENNTFFMRGVDKWFLVAFNRGEKTSEGNDILRPDKCFVEDYCLCICEKSPSAISCQEHGFCRKMDRPINMETTFSFNWLNTGSRTAGRDDYLVKCLPFYKTDIRPIFVSKSSFIFVNSTLPKMDLGIERDKEFRESLIDLDSNSYPCTKMVEETNYGSSVRPTDK